MKSEKAHFVAVSHFWCDACDGAEFHAKFVTMAQDTEEAIKNVKLRLRILHNFRQSDPPWSGWIFIAREARFEETVELKD